MCKILVIEPDSVIVNDMITLMKNQHHHLDLILHTEKSDNALSLCGLHHPDLIMVNVDSDQKDCFSMIDQIKVMYPDIYIILLLDENDTFHLKTTLRKRNERFILKPIDSANFLEILDSCIAEIEIIQHDTAIISNLEEQIQLYKPQIERNLIHSIATNAPIELLAKDFGLLQCVFGEGILMTMFKQKEKELTPRILQLSQQLHISYIHSDFYDYHVIMLYVQQHFKLSDINQLKNLLGELNANHFLISVGSVQYDLKNLHHSYVEISKHLLSCQTDSTPLPFRSHDFSHDKQTQIRNYAQHVFQYFLMMNDSYVKSYLKTIALDFAAYDFATIQQLTNNFFSQLHKLIAASFHDTTALSSPIPIKKNSSIHEFQQLFLKKFQELVDPILLMRNDAPHTQLRKILYFILKNHTDNQLSLHTTSVSLQISPCYICKLFKNYTDFSFTEFINDCRIEHAKVQLKTNKRIKSIAYDVGYQSSTYFGRVFKSRIGLTPKTYRMQYGIPL